METSLFLSFFCSVKLKKKAEPKTKASDDQKWFLGMSWIRILWVDPPGEC